MARSAEKDLEKSMHLVDKFNESINTMTMDRMNEAPKQEMEPQTKLSSKDIEKSKDIYLKPKRSIGCKEKFNEKFRDQYNFQKEYVHFIAENKEIIGEDIDIWTRPFPGMPAEEWMVPTNKPIWGPRYLAEQISKCNYHRLIMKQTTVGGDGMGEYYGQMAVDTTVPRLEARPVSIRKSVFTGANGF